MFFGERECKLANRGRLEIIYDILDVVRRNKNKIKSTPLLRQSNISTSRFKDYFTELIDKSFIEEIEDKSDKFYSLTKKGFMFLERFRTIVDFIDEFGLG